MNFSVKMNISCLTHSDFISDLIGYYAIPIVSLFGLLLNFLISILLKNKELKHSFYKYLFIKAILDTVICLIGN